MSYDVFVRHIADSGDGVSIEVKVNGTPMAHTFPKGKGWLERKPRTDRPRFVDKFIRLYKKRHADSEITVEEKRARGSDFENEEFSV